MEKDQKQTLHQSRPNNVILLKCSDESFFRMWIEFLTPFHKLADREKDVAARLLSQYFKLKDQCSDMAVLKQLLLSTTSRQDMRNSLGMSVAHFQMCLGKLRSSGVIVDEFINPKFVPHLDDDRRTFELRVVFDWTSKGNPDKK